VFSRVVKLALLPMPFKLYTVTRQGNMIIS